MTSVGLFHTSFPTLSENDFHLFNHRRENWTRDADDNSCSLSHEGTEAPLLSALSWSVQHQHLRHTQGKTQRRGTMFKCKSPLAFIYEILQLCDLPRYQDYCCRFELYWAQPTRVCHQCYRHLPRQMLQQKRRWMETWSLFPPRDTLYCVFGTSPS